MKVHDGRDCMPGFCQQPAWLLVLAAIVGVQAFTTLSRFSTERSWRPLVDSRPITCGRHPLHYYHGLLGARSWRDGQFGACFDPAYCAGYPKTPIFDSGSRPAELFFLLGGDRPQAYKIGLAACCAIVPLVFAAAARLLQFSAATACVAAALALLGWWGAPVQKLMEHGHLDGLFAGLAAVLHAALLVRFHQGGSWATWLALSATAALGWFCQPGLWFILSIWLALCYLSFCLQHGLSWNATVWAAWAIGLAINLFWLVDGLRFWWTALPISATSPVDRALSAWWEGEIWGGRADRLLALLMLGGGVAAAVTLAARRRYAAGGVFAATAGLLVALSAVAGYAQILETVGLSNLFALALAFAVVLCAWSVTALFAALNRLAKHRIAGVVVALLLIGGLLVPLRKEARQLGEQATRARPLPLGLTDDQRALIHSIRKLTRREARILFEDRARPSAAWTPLLHLETERDYLGGLGSNAEIEHAHARLTGRTLAGRPLAEWTDAELMRFCDRYNVGHIVCFSPEALTRFHSWEACEALTPIVDECDGVMFAVRRNPTFVLRGKARMVQMDARRIALQDVEPEDGLVILSLHYQSGWRVSPSHVTAEPEIDPYDPIPMTRLRMNGPVMRITLMWEGTNRLRQFGFSH